MATGLAVGKLIGLFFFIYSPILPGVLYQTITLPGAGCGFVMCSSWWLPSLLPTLCFWYPKAKRILDTQRQQLAAMFGWSVAYTKGPAAWFPMIQEYYGQWFSSVGFHRCHSWGNQIPRLLYVLILTWSVPTRCTSCS
jgi:hypothetical protein